jgi:putative DNA primase/helicase
MSAEPMCLEERIALGLVTVTGYSEAGFSDNYEPPKRLSAARHPLTDAGNSLRFSEDHTDELIYVSGLGWHYWDGKRWARDDAAAWRAAKETARRMRYEAGAIEDSEISTKVFAHALRSESKPRLDAMIELASKGEIEHMGLVVPVAKIDANPYALNCRNGTVSLKTGKLHPHQKELYITHLVDVDYDEKATSPLWDKTLRGIFENDDDLIGYVQRAVGYSATGAAQREKCFFLPYGSGNNGKTVFTETVKLVLGELARVAASDTFVTSKGSSIQNDLASLRDARFVLVPETEDGDRLARQVIKRVTGGNTIRARFMYRDWFSYMPQFTIWIETNHLPAVPVSDQAAWDRIKVVPFRRTFSKKEQNSKLREQLATELPGILAWVVSGARAWYKHGLGELPLAVAKATFDYRASQDTIGRFLHDETEDDLESNVLRVALHDAYKTWCAAEGVVAVSARAFREALQERGYRAGERNVGRTFEGLKLLR